MSAKKTAVIKVDVKEFLKMARDRGLEKNALFLSSLETYMLQLRVIDSIRESIEADGTTVEKEYVKGRENLYTHPCIKELPRHTDSANKTATLLFSILKEMGKQPKVKGRLDALMEDE